MSEKDILLLANAKDLMQKLEDFKKFMNLYEMDEEEQLFCERGKNSLDFVIGEFKDIVENLE